MSISRTLTREDLLKDLRPVYIAKLVKAAPNMVDNGDLAIYQHFSNANKKPLEALMDDWCEYLSEDWFKLCPDVDDVLVLTSPSNSTGPSQKIWMASRD